MVEATVKQRAFAIIGILGFAYVGAVFSTVNTMCWDSTRLWLPGGEVGTVAFKTVFPRPFYLMQQSVAEA